MKDSLVSINQTPKPRRFILMCRAIIGLFLLLFVSAPLLAQVPTPRSVLGFQPTDDRTIADWTQITNYFKKLDDGSPRVVVREIGRTTLGKPMIAAFISSPQNIANLDKLRQINQRLANPAGLSAAETETLIAQGRTIVSISCSIHSTEIVASQMSMNLAYELASANDPTTVDILNNTVLILIPSSNPDGIDIVADWYRKTLNTKSEGTTPPELYHHYAGHDNNRDWFMMNLAETRAITKLYWQEWFPQIVYDVHQQGQFSSRFVIPPFYDPANPRVSPVILRELGLIGYRMAADLQSAGIKGVATNASYDTWWHGGFRSAPYYHNAIGILSEAASSNLMTPAKVTEQDLQRARGTRGIPNLLEPATNFPDPWRGGTWRPADIAQIEMIASRGLLEMAAKFRLRYLRNFNQLSSKNLVRDDNEPAAFIIPAGQPNGEYVSRLLEILMWQGVEVHRMTSEGYFTHTTDPKEEFHEMPANSFLVFVNQVQKNNVLSLFEKQRYPQRLLANGEAEVPYDVAGWTLPLQMGVETLPITRVRDADAFTKTVQRVRKISEARTVMNLSARDGDFGKMPNPLKTGARVGLYKGYISSMDEGWTRLVFDTFNVPYKSVSDNDVRTGNLPFDTIVLPADSEGAIINGLSAERYPAEFAGGIGENGAANLQKFVENGGRLVCFDDSCELAIKRFALPVKNVLSGLRRNEFYNPGSIVGLNVNRRNRLSEGFGPEAAAYFSNSSAFDILDPARVKTAARYAERDALLSGWMLGEKYLNGKAALIEVSLGKGSVIMFGFRPQHRGQSWGTFGFIFNALEKSSGE